MCHTQRTFQVWFFFGSREHHRIHNKHVNLSCCAFFIRCVLNIGFSCCIFTISECKLVSFMQRGYLFWLSFHAIIVVVAIGIILFRPRLQALLLFRLYLVLIFFLNKIAFKIVGSHKIAGGVWCWFRLKKKTYLPKIKRKYWWFTPTVRQCRFFLLRFSGAHIYFSPKIVQ